MAEKKKHFWQHRRFYGILFGGTGAIIATIPGTPVLVTIGAISVTTMTVSVTCGLIGTYVFGWGQGRAEEKAKITKLTQK